LDWERRGPPSAPTVISDHVYFDRRIADEDFLAEPESGWNHPAMGIYDRDYMKAPQAQPRRLKPSLWQRLRFRLWLLFKGKNRD